MAHPESLPNPPRSIQNEARILYERMFGSAVNAIGLNGDLIEDYVLGPGCAEIDEDEFRDAFENLDPKLRALLEEAQQIADEYERG